MTAGRAMPEQPYELIADGTFPDAVYHECLHTRRHAQHSLWSKTPHYPVSHAMRAAHPEWSVCRRCLDRPGRA